MEPRIPLNKEPSSDDVGRGEWTYTKNSPVGERNISNCEICGTEFTGRKGTKYCSDKCRRIAWNEYMRLREEEKRFIEKFAEEQRKRMEWLVKNQEFEEDYVLDKKCYVCNCNDENKLLAHHVRYNPPTKVTLCASCHTFLHKVLLRKKAKGRNIK